MERLTQAESWAIDPLRSRVRFSVKHLMVATVWGEVKEFEGTFESDGWIGTDPLARVVSRGVHGVDPDVFGIAPVEAANKALARAGIGWGDVDVVELNEAFASQSLACLAGWPELDPEKFNKRGGALAIGHPLGASGARVIGRVAHELAAGGGRYGLAAICIGVGQGLAMVLEA